MIGKHYMKKRVNVFLMLIFFTSFFIFIPKNIDLTNVVPYGTLILLAVVLLSFLSLMINNRKVILYNDYFVIILLFYMLFTYSLFTAVWSDSPFEVAWRSIIVFLPILIIAYIMYFVDNVVFSVLCFYIFNLSCGLLLSIIGLVIYYFGQTYWADGVLINELRLGSFSISQIMYISSGLLRISSITGNPNTLGYILVISSVSTIGLFFMNKIRVIFLLLLLSPQLLALFFTYSRTSWAMFLIIIFILSLLLRGKNSHISNVVLHTMKIICAFIMLLAMLYIIYSDKSNQRFSLDLNGRLEGWKPLLDLFNEKLMFGNGFNTSADYLYQNEIDISNAHNIYIAILSEIGLVGMLIFIMILMASIWLISKVCWPFSKEYFGRDEYVPIVVNLSLLIGILFHQLFESSILRFSYLNLIWVYVLFSSLKLKEALIQ